MEVVRRCLVTRLLVAGFAIFVFVGCPHPGGAATDAVLVVETADELKHLYKLSKLEQVTFAGEELQVVTEGGTDTYPLESIVRLNLLGDLTGIADGQVKAGVLKAVHLFQNYPNPFNPGTRIAFELPGGGQAELRIYDVKGRLIRTLIESELPAGPHSVWWDGRNEQGGAVASGVYFYSLTAPRVKESRKMILLR